MEMEMADGSEVAQDAPQPTHIDVHVHQESALAKLLLSRGSLLRLLFPAVATATRSPGSSRLLVASWVVQIVLGVLSGVLGGLLYLSKYYILYRSGAAIWTGVVAVAAGAAAFTYQERGGICWALLRTLLALGAFFTAIAAIIIEAKLHYHGYYFSHYMCDFSRSRNWHSGSSSTLSPEEGRRIHPCIAYQKMMNKLSISLQAMLLGVWILLLLASLAPLGLYCWRRSPLEKKRDQKKLLGVHGIQPCLS
ncbi:transmembrane protein 176A [Lepus europaeus]|uniref:transmembrane protein 176A n=1 Tax=Lepus europaeus TaxID=9983 RepID=UPI002B487869|nr:transmembrane protein 176A [Lepus europaeus]